jgi:hypothetical protein
MWYREAITRVDPSGQINMDFPGIKPKPFDIDKNVKFEVEEYDENSYRINANIDEKILGHIDFEAKDYSDTAKIIFVELYEYPLREAQEEWELFNNPSDRTKTDMSAELRDAGYNVGESSITRTKWGIGKRLYQEMKKFLQNYKPSIQYISGDVHSREAFESRNSVFGLPIESYDPSESYGYKIEEKTSKQEREDLTRKMPYELLPARFDAMGSGDIPPDSFMVKHRLRRLPYNQTQKYKDSKKIPQSYDISSLEADSDVV